MSKIKIIALIGKAGAGKDTIMKSMIKQCPYLHEIVSCTTRPRREYEIDGINYYFYTVEQFTKKVLNNEMLEATEFNGWFYGTSLDSLSLTDINVGVFNPDGISAMYDRNDIDLRIYYITASDKTRLLRQLNREDFPNVDEIIRRYETDRKDFLTVDDEFDPKHIQNDDKNSIMIQANKILRDCADWLDEAIPV